MIHREMKVKVGDRFVVRPEAIADGCPAQPGELVTLRHDDRTGRPFLCRLSNDTTWWFKRSDLDPYDEPITSEQLPIGNLI